jgi:hypothetical protein
MAQGSWQRRSALWAARILGALIAVPALYFVAALFLGLIPANAAWRQAESGIAIFVRTNGVHTWILMPKTNAYMDWRPFIPGSHVRDPRWDAANYAAFGYGEREVYLNTPTWGDLSIATAARAAFGGGEALVHVEHVHEPQVDADTRRIVLRPDGYRDNDIFYQADGGYSAILTCNEWTGRALRTAGVRTGLWTPLEQSIMWRLD